MKRTCKKCGKRANWEKFPLAGVIKGVTYRRHLCAQCYSKSKGPRKAREWTWFVDYKKTLSCANCGNADFRVLDFDHLAGTEKEFNIGDARRKGYSRERIMNEVAKCQVLCANCHRIKTYEDTHRM